MLLHSLRLRHWRNIAKLELDDLGQPLVVLHGPNRTGKSSLVLALRYCLFDFDHDSRAAALKSCVPRRTKHSPEVAVEFEHGGKRYRLRKIFSPAKDGDAWLEELTATGSAVLERGKEAGRQARKLLGVERSSEGLNELLWLTQGEVKLPTADRLSGPLQQRLEQVLGSLLTPHDWKFQALLQKAMDEYFTATKGRHKKNSPVLLLSEALDKKRAEVDQLRRESSQCEALVTEFEGLEEQIHRGRDAVAESEREVAIGENLAHDVTARRTAHEQAQVALKAAEKERDECRKRLDDYKAVRQGLVNVESRIVQAQGELQATEQVRQQAATELQEVSRQLDAHRQQRNTLDRAQAECDERERLLAVTVELERLAATLQQVSALEKSLETLGQGLNGLSAPDEKALQSLRKQAQTIQRLQAEVDAAALQVEVVTDAAETVELARDGGDPLPLPTTAGEPRTESFRQRMELQVPGWGVVRVMRGRQDESLDETARKLTALRREYAVALGRYGLEEAEDDALERLARRQAERDALLREQASIQERLRALAPHGRSDLLSRQAEQQRIQDDVLRQFPALAKWVPDRADLDRLKREIAANTRRLRDELQQLEVERDRKLSAKNAAEQSAHQCKEAIAGLEANREFTGRRMRELGDETTLRHALEQAETACHAAAEQVRATALTDEERQIDQRLREARTALERRRERLNEYETQAAVIRGRLQQMQGLHEDLAAAEAELHRLTRAHEERSVDAAAHQLLSQVFEDCRTSQVQATTGRIESQVVTWARRLGLGEYESVQFGKGYLPDGLRLPAIEETVPVEDESYGTLEQFALLVRLAIGRLVADGQPHIALLDDPLTHADLAKHRRMLEILEDVASGRGSPEEGSPVAPLQVVVLTCHPERFDHLTSARHVNLAHAVCHEPA